MYSVLPPDVLSQVDTPQLSSVELVAVEVDVSRQSRLGVVLGVCRVPFDDYLVLPVAVDVAHGAVVGSVAVILSAKITAGGSV